MYKKEVKAKIAKVLHDMTEDYKSLIKEGKISKAVVISSGNQKIGRVLNVSLAPMLTCGNCKACSDFCYDIKACIQYPNVRDARAYNTAVMMTNREKYFSDIRAKIGRRRKNKYFRWHVSGDIVDLPYFIEMVKIAKENPDFTFWTYTKMYVIVNMYCDRYGKDSIPQNLHVMFSKWDRVPMNNPYNFPVFACKLKDGNVDTSEDWFAKVFKCPGNCDICKGISRGCIKGEDTYADEH